LHGQIAVVTGGTAGIGLHAAVLLARRGATVVVVSRSPARVHSAIEQVNAEVPGAKCIGLACDVSVASEAERLGAFVEDKYGRVDIVVAAAGVLRVSGGQIRSLQDTPLEDYEEIIRINLTGTYLTNRAFLPLMLRQQSGFVINLSSTSGRKGYAFDTCYCASKFGVIGMTEALAHELRPRGIRVCAVLPGAIETDMWDQNGPIPKPEALLPVERVALLIAEIACSPDDVELDEVIIEPFQQMERPAWRTSRGRP
jgi:NAD(P)-dependent dehydrogenase (short-subunit alcohol dehydrogenase family)